MSATGEVPAAKLSVSGSHSQRFLSSVDLVVQWEFVLLGVRAPQAVSCLGTGGAEKGT